MPVLGDQPGISQQPQFRILRRPQTQQSTSNNHKDSANNGGHQLKTLEERQAEYARARLRILGAAYPEEPEDVEDCEDDGESSTSESVNGKRPLPNDKVVAATTADNDRLQSASPKLTPAAAGPPIDHSHRVVSDAVASCSSSSSLDCPMNGSSSAPAPAPAPSFLTKES